MKHVLFIIYTHTLGGGAEKILTTIVNHLDPEKYQIDILEYAQYDVKREGLNSNIHRLPPVLSMKNDGKWSRLFKNIQVFSLPHWLKRHRKKYDLEISFNYLIPTFLLSHRCPSIAWIHGSIDDLKQNAYYRMLERAALGKVNRIVAISENTYRSILDVYPQYKKKIELIYNGFDFDAIRSASREVCPIQIQHPAICFAGRLEKNKNPTSLIAAVDMLRKKGKRVYLYLMGEGVQRDALTQQIHDLELDSQISLLGYQNNPYPVMAQCDVIGMLSKSEGFPTVFPEAMSLGVPFVSTPVGGIAELSDDGRCGLVVQTVEDCTQALESILYNKERWTMMSHACIKHIQQYSLEHQIKKIEALVDRVLDEEPCG